MKAPIEDRIAIEDMFTAYCAAIDERCDANVAASFYIEGGVLDNTALGSPLVEGRRAVQETIDGMFASMANLEHYLSNFLLLNTDADAAAAEAYVQAFATPKGGDAFTMRGIYRLETRRADGVWKIARLTFQPFGQPIG
jgi:ketosteroid isomerase-like protein